MDFASARLRLIEELRSEIKDKRVLEVMARIPRELFIPAEQAAYAYDDRPLPIGLGQTISQPFIVALMTQALELKGSEKVLELGTGSGYQAVILAELASKVVTVERLPQLAESAKKVFEKLGYTNIEVHLAEKQLGWPQEAPYDGILVSAGAPRIPEVLLEQLADGGRMVVPVGSRFEQDLLKVVKKGDRVITHNLGGCRFVPLVGEGAWDEPSSQQ